MGPPVRDNPAVAIDRIAPTKRPDGPNKGTQRWRNLVFAHWQISPAELRPHVPAELELDMFDGTCFIGLVPFEMHAIRSSWMPRFAGLNFLETNLRTYVLHNGRPGVYFFSLEASSWLAVKVARAVWKLPYFHACMHQHPKVTDDTAHHYDTVRYDDPAANLKLDYRRRQPLPPPKPGSLEHFLVERYYLFSLRGSEVMLGQVHHPPYPLHGARCLDIHEGLIAAAGMPKPGRTPDLFHFSPGVDVEVFGPWPQPSS